MFGLLQCLILFNCSMFQFRYFSILNFEMFQDFSCQCFCKFSMFKSWGTQICLPSPDIVNSLRTPPRMFICSLFQILDFVVFMFQLNINFNFTLKRLVKNSKIHLCLQTLFTNRHLSTNIVYKQPFLGILVNSVCKQFVNSLRKLFTNN